MRKSTIEKITEESFARMQGIILAIAKRYVQALPAESVIATEDLFMEGLIVYLEIINRYDPSVARFNTFLTYCVQNKFRTIIHREIKKYRFAYYAIPIQAFDSKPNQEFCGEQPPEAEPDLVFCPLLSDDLSPDAQQILSSILDPDFEIPEYITKLWTSKPAWIKCIAEITGYSSARVAQARDELRAIVEGYQKPASAVAA